MTFTLVTVLENAEINLKTPISRKLGMEQLHNANVLISKGYDLYDEVSELFTTYSSSEDVPDKEK